MRVLPLQDGAKKQACAADASQCTTQKHGLPVVIMGDGVNIPRNAAADGAEPALDTTSFVMSATEEADAQGQIAGEQGEVARSRRRARRNLKLAGGL